MTTSQSATDGAVAAAAIPLLGKRKEPPQQLPPPPTSLTSSSSSSPTNAVVDAAFKRLFGYSWGTTFDILTTSTTKDIIGNGSVSGPSSVERQMIQIFGPTRTARILNLPWDVVAPVSTGSDTSYMDDYYNPAAMLTTKIVSTNAAVSMPSSLSAAAALQSDSSIRRSKKMRLEELDYKNIALPSHMVSSSSSPSATTNTSQSAARATTTTSTSTTSNLDSVLSQIAGKKQINTVEKSSNDWEGFKESDKTLQDELERNAQSKNAYLVKQDFLNRVDHRKFELEKEERDRSRSRRGAEGSK